MDRRNESILYIDPMVDYGFKKIFKESGNKELLMRPLNVIFDLNIIDIDIQESEHSGETEEDRRACFDLYCMTADKRKFIIEVQLASQPYFPERSLYYMTFPISESAPKDNGVLKKWNYNYPPVFFMGLLNFNMRHLVPELADSGQYIHLFSLRDEHTGELLTDRLRFAFLEVARFEKRKEDCVSFEDRFLFMMKNLPTFAKKPALWDDPYFEMLLCEAEYARMDRTQRRKYRNSLKMKYDYVNTVEYAEQRGREQQALETARRMLAKNREIGEIIEFTGLTEKQIKALAA